jgi:hypothetical protein
MEVRSNTMTLRRMPPPRVGEPARSVVAVPYEEVGEASFT